MLYIAKLRPLKAGLDGSQAGAKLAPFAVGGHKLVRQCGVKSLGLFQQVGRHVAGPVSCVLFRSRGELRRRGQRKRRAQRKGRCWRRGVQPDRHAHPSCFPSHCPAVQENATTVIQVVIQASIRTFLSRRELVIQYPGNSARRLSRRFSAAIRGYNRIRPFAPAVAGISLLGECNG